MKTTAVVLLFSLVGSAVLAHEGHHHNKEKSVDKLTGEVVDITCYLDHESKGEKHSSCARKCIESGMPVGLVAGDKLYVVIVSSHEPPNAKLAPYAGKLVTITGKLLQREGLRAIDMDDVRPVESAAAAEKKD
jgi:hypothetical protein